MLQILILLIPSFYWLLTGGLKKYFSDYSFSIIATYFLYGLLPELVRLLLVLTPHTTLDQTPAPTILTCLFFSAYFLIILAAKNYLLPNRFFAALAISHNQIRNSFSRSKIIKVLSIITAFSLIALSFLYISLSGPSIIQLWLENFSASYIEQRRGYGLIFMWFPILTRLLAFLWGIEKISIKPSKLPLQALYLFALLCGIFLAGFKSPFAFAVLFFCSSSIFLSRASSNRLILLLFISLLFIFAGNLVRSNGYYVGLKAIEYLPHYFNTLNLHDQLLQDSLVLNRINPYAGIAYWIDLLSGNPLANDSRSISNQLTSIIFPSQWAAGGTQQWPIITSLFLSYGPNPLVWIPSILIFIFTIRVVLIRAILPTRLTIAWQFIYLNEFTRFFTVYRSSHFDFDTVVFNYIPYFLVYLLFLLALRLFPFRLSLYAN